MQRMQVLLVLSPGSYLGTRVRCCKQAYLCKCMHACVNNMCMLAMQPAEFSMKCKWLNQACGPAILIKGKYYIVLASFCYLSRNKSLLDLVFCSLTPLLGELHMPRPDQLKTRLAPHVVYQARSSLTDYPSLSGGEWEMVQLDRRTPPSRGANNMPA